MNERERKKKSIQQAANQPPQRSVSQTKNAEGKTKEAKKETETFKQIARLFLTPELSFRRDHTRLQRFWKWLRQITVAEFGMFLLTLVIVGTGIVYTKYAKRQWEVSRDTLNVSQRAYVTIGRADGVIADFIAPKDPEQRAEIVIYFQNTGHVPAKFSWGTMLPGFNATLPGKKQTTGIEYTHPFKGLPARTKIGEHGGESTTIAGGSVLISTLGTISQKDLADLPANSAGLLIMGELEYCDQIGTYSRRHFELSYRPNAPSPNMAFSLLHEDFDIPIKWPIFDGTTEHLFPCETESERNGIKQK